MHWTTRPSLPKAAIFLALALLATSLACRSSADTANTSEIPTNPPLQRGAGGIALVWEAWDSIEQSYVNAESLDSDAVVGSIIQSLLDLTGAPPYPFLTEVGRVRGQPPAAVPPELGDVWRALVLHQQKWPQFQHSSLAQAAIAGMVRGLGDPLAGFITAEKYAQSRESLAGSYQGIGTRVVVDQDRILLFPGEGAQAAKAGIRSGDVLLAVEGQPVAGRSVSEVIEQVKGPAGTKVKLRVGRAGEPGPLEYEVPRGNVEIPSVRAELFPGAIGYISISEFKGNTGEQLIRALETSTMRNMLALILDLRSNPGGSVEAARQVVSQFLPPGGLFVYETDRAGKRRDWPILEEGLAVKALPMVVLVDEDTLSVAEAVAGALQDAGRAVLMGTRTAGKGSINTFVKLTDGSAIYLPTSRWYTPSGHLLEGTGIAPDAWVPFQREERGLGRERQLNQAYEYLNSRLPPFR